MKILKKLNLQESVFNEENLKLRQKHQETFELEVEDLFVKISNLQVTGFEGISTLIKGIRAKAQKKFSADEETLNLVESELQENNFYLGNEFLVQREVTLKEAIKLTLSALNSDFKVGEANLSNALRAELRSFEKEVEMKNSMNIMSEQPKEKKKATEPQIAEEKKPKINLMSMIDISYDKVKAFKEEEIKRQLPVLKNTSEAVEGSMKSYKYFSSDLLNDLKVRLVLSGKLTGFEIQILTFLSHILVSDLVASKQGMHNYDGIINPTELIELLRSAKIQH